VKVLVVDDEPLARARLVRMLGRIEGVEVAGEAESGEEALRMAAELAPDLMLLDVDMPGMSGLAVAEHADLPPIVFTTAHTQYALEAFEADAHDYLLKPVSRERLARAIAKVRARAAAPEPPPAAAHADVEEPWRLVVTDGTMRVFADAREVTCFLADQKYVAFRWRDRELLLRESLDTLEARLAPLGVLRPHRGALVMRRAVVAFDAAEGGTLVLTDDQRVPVSRRALAAIRDALGVR
jgi:DNA-binding LytR/AlgR family response regulator